MSEVAFTAPHYLAAELGLDVLKRGGNAVDAMVAAAAMIAVQYPHMNSLGGDSFWLIQAPGEQPVAIDACGCAAKNISIEYFTGQGYDAIPQRGHQATVCSAGTVAGWQRAREVLPSSMPLAELLEPSAQAAEAGVTITDSLRAGISLCASQFDESEDFEQFRKIYLEPVQAGADQIHNPAMASLFRQLANQGLDSFYRGDIAATLVNELGAIGSKLSESDFSEYNAKLVDPLSNSISKGTLYNFAAPTQGLASLLILSIYDQIYDPAWTEADKVHALVEATKLAFEIRDAEVTDPSRLRTAQASFLEKSYIQKLASGVDIKRAKPWPKPSSIGDTVWMGALDKNGVMVSFIQSVYWEFGSGFISPEYGIAWNNRGVSFSLDSQHPNALAPGLKPFHTLNPAFAELEDGRRMAYGTMGGEGQPQTQAALFTRCIYEGLTLSDSIAQPRWLLGRTWGETSNNLKIEQELFDRISTDLKGRGHDLECIPGISEKMGHAGAIMISPDGSVDLASDPRSDGAALKAVV